MVAFGRLTHPGKSIVAEISKTKNLGFDYVEIGIEMPAFLTYNKYSILKSLRKFKNPPVGHTTWWYDLGSIFESVKLGWVEQAKNDMMTANLLGIKLLNFHFLVLSKFLLLNKKSMKIISENYVKSLKELSGFAKEKNITIMLENGEEKFEYYKYVLDRVPAVKVHLDIGHAFISGGMNNIERFIYYFRNRIEHIHIHDNHGKTDEHLALGKGNINWKKVVNMLKKTKYDKTITFEVFKTDKDLIRSREYFRRLWWS